MDPTANLQTMQYFSSERDYTSSSFIQSDKHKSLFLGPDFYIEKIKNKKCWESNQYFSHKHHTLPKRKKIKLLNWKFGIKWPWIRC